MAALFAAIWIAVQAGYSQYSREAFRGSLREEAGLTAEELARLDRHELVVKMLPVSVKEETAVFGILRLADLPALTMRSFREGLDQNNTTDFEAGGTLSRPPVIRDLARLSFEDRDLDDLKACRVGDCKVKLPASMITELQSGIDWNAPDHRSRAAERLKQFLISYSADYLQRGDRALIEYADKKKPVKLSEQYQSMIDGMLMLNLGAPEFKAYLLGFPAVSLECVEDTLDWSKISSGLKPVISITHGPSFAKRTEGGSMLFIGAKQLYSNHYVDASMTVTTLVQISTGDSAETFLVFENRSRSDALAGMFGKIVRGLTEKEAIQRVTDLLSRAGPRIEAIARRLPEPPVQEMERSITYRIIDAFTRPVLIALVLIAIAAAVPMLRRFRR